MSFTVLIPARLASSRLPGKPLADIAGLPMVVRVARRAALSAARSVVVATDAPEVVLACQQHSVQVVMTRADHTSGSDRLAEASTLLGLADSETVVNVQGDEPLIDPALIDAVAALLGRSPLASMSTAAYPIASLDDFNNPNVVKVVLDATGHALYFSRAPIPHWRDRPARCDAVAAADTQALWHVGIYAYRAGFLRRFPTLAAAPIEGAEALEQLRALWHGHRIAVHVTLDPPGLGVDTPEDLERARRLLAG